MARGRIWSGSQAKQRGLVDEIGGLAGYWRLGDLRIVQLHPLQTTQVLFQTTHALRLAAHQQAAQTGAMCTLRRLQAVEDTYAGMITRIDQGRITLDAHRAAAMCDLGR